VFCDLFICNFFKEATQNIWCDQLNGLLLGF